MFIKKKKKRRRTERGQWRPHLELEGRDRKKWCSRAQGGRWAQNHSQDPRSLQDWQTQAPWEARWSWTRNWQIGWKVKSQVDSRDNFFSAENSRFTLWWNKSESLWGDDRNSWGLVATQKAGAKGSSDIETEPLKVPPLTCTALTMYQTQSRWHYTFKK